MTRYSEETSRPNQNCVQNDSSAILVAYGAEGLSQDLATIHIFTLDWISGCTLCNMAGVTEAQASIMRRRRSYNVGGRVAYTCPFICPHKKKSNGVKSVERGGHSTKPPYPMT
ncbi:hypothetical protein AVEN_206446-1 [Araneus ventricosus]|uniref:Uncharacterized protein n=1 Tax=Araneus ventricosus TaxID=182803 RepID=A0A4Y2NJJ2_ARAVE|nr:hypothetical protein AVEN_206446-1 [Araneus ventricosus]